MKESKEQKKGGQNKEMKNQMTRQSQGVNKLKKQKKTKK